MCVYTEQFAAPLLKVLDHHSTELIIWAYHFIVDVDYIALRSEELLCPLEYPRGFFSLHVDQYALCNDDCGKTAVYIRPFQLIYVDVSVSYISRDKFVSRCVKLIVTKC